MYDSNVDNTLPSLKHTVTAELSGHEMLFHIIIHDKRSAQSIIPVDTLKMQHFTFVETRCTI